jgi:23S rRNA pseudouridine2605 synthase
LVKVRIGKYLATKNICSRRDAERYISAGEITVNGKRVSSPICFVDDDDEVALRGEIVRSEKKVRMWLYYKPVGEITTHKDPKKRKTVFESILERNIFKNGERRVISVGRLDINSEGLLILTNDSLVANKIERSSWPRVYRVRGFGQLNTNKMRELASFVSHNKFEFINLWINGIVYSSVTIEITGSPTKNFWCYVTLTEGKNREVRKIMNFFGVQVNRLIRQKYGDFSIEGLNPGEIKEVRLPMPVAP